MAAPQRAEQNKAIDPQELTVLENITFPEGLGIKYLRSGKIREASELGGNLVLVTTDRISAFDRVLGTVPGKGQILNEQSAWWFGQMKDIIPNHVIAVPDPNVTVVRKLTPVPVEVIVRGVITGVTDTSLWVNYTNADPDKDGNRQVYGIRFPPGLKKNDILAEPVITPTTKAEQGQHDEKISEADIVSKGIVEVAKWQTIRTAALAMFSRAQAIARAHGFILVDTKIEFGTDEAGNVYVMDELFTGDSSRFWLESTMQERLQANQEPDNYDKEYLRIAYKAMGYGGEGTMPDQVPLQIQQELLRRYVAVYEALTGRNFEYPRGDIALRIRANMGEFIVHEAIRNREGEHRSPRVVVIMGSKSDLDHANEIRKTLDKFGVPCDLRIGSAHKNPEDVLAMIKTYDADEGKQTVYIAVAGRSNALGGMIAGASANPVINCPPKGEWYDIYSSLRMPSGIAASVVIEPESAALFAIEVFAGTRPELTIKFMAHQQVLRDKVRRDDQEIFSNDQSH